MSATLKMYALKRSHLHIQRLYVYIRMVERSDPSLRELEFKSSFTRALGACASGLPPVVLNF